MAGHGHVTPNDDGSKARCGGPVICSDCARELAVYGQGRIQQLEAELAEERELVEQMIQTKGNAIFARDEAIAEAAMRIAQLEAEAQEFGRLANEAREQAENKLRRYHSSVCNVFLDDESDVCLDDFQHCTCDLKGADKLLKERDAAIAERAAAVERWVIAEDLLAHERAAWHTLAAGEDAALNAAIAEAAALQVVIARVTNYVDWMLTPENRKGLDKAFRDACVGIGINLKVILDGKDGSRPTSPAVKAWTLLADALAMLERCEWAGSCIYGYDGDSVASCPECLETEEDGHSPTCEYAALLVRLREVK